jgi:hypothetical protein
MPLCPPVALLVHDRVDYRPCASHLLFSEAYQHLWLLSITTFIESSHTLPIPLTLAPIRLVLAEPSSPRGLDGNFMLRVHCPQAVLLRRVLLMEQQVRPVSPFSGTIT